MARPSNAKTVESLTHDEARRKNIPTAEYQSVLPTEQQQPKQIGYPRPDADKLGKEKSARNRDLDPQLVWRGKDEQDWSDLVVSAPPLYIQEKVHPKVLIDDLLRSTKERKHEAGQITADLFADFNGIPKGADKTDFYQHDQNWTNRMILGDSLQVMASLAEREGLRGKVQCIYLDPPYGIKFNSNFQWSTTSRDVKDGNAGHITREPEQVKAFRDTWRDGIHSYLTYLRDRLTVARDLLTESGSIFVQIGDENVHRVRAVMDEVFGEHNFISQITVRKTTSEGNTLLGATCDFVLWFGKHKEATRARTLYASRSEDSEGRYTSEYFDGSFYRLDNVTSSRPAGDGDVTNFQWFGEEHTPGKGTFKTKESGLIRLGKADRFVVTKNGKLNYRRSQADFGYGAMGNLWADISGAVQSRSDPKIYVVQTSTSIVGRCLLLATDPGDLVLDPTCGSGTTATVAEQWGRRWITIDTSRVALALARARIMGARYPFYLLADSREGQLKEAEVTRSAPSTQPVHGNLRHGFVYERVPHITLKSIANNAEIDVIWEQWQGKLEPLREALNAALGKTWQEWEIPRELSKSVRPELVEGRASTGSARTAEELHRDWWQARIARQKEIDTSIAARADFETLYDKPYENKKCVRVAGPFTVESLSPHRMIGVDEDDELIDGFQEDRAEYSARQSFPQLILENLKTAGVQQAHREDRISFTALTPWPGEGAICAEGRYLEGQEGEMREKRAGIFIGPEFGTVQRSDLVEAARECGEAGFDALIACAFNYEAHATEFSKLGRIPVLKARMNADLHMAADLKTTGQGNLFVIFGEPDISLLPQDDGKLCIKVNGVDVFKPQTGEVVSDSTDGIACWFIDTDYNQESFFVRYAYFLGANDPYSALKTTLKAEIDPEAWASLNSDTSRPFEKPKSGRIAVKVINHLGDEVMKVFKV
ncbi:putative DNA methylase [Candidatus Accumulibacter aalborgensis]|uniref:site-specific DNA-methyltransferase (adenine-specific) n=1 Tax=Candidatus Accumulibacter aalborgensis TaxID=1860102 RepID=A0A1A8XWY7_9PROT|nr:site-specific DNA-methyltransferase [Candidatus Accumulibacter aalborgensis]SBT09500.1 putative DNA methylase [Candidatus Accumulibacter aalborgensis]